MWNTLKRWLHFWIAVIIQFNNDGCFYRAAALTLTSLLSIVPLLAVSLSVLAAFPEFKPFGEQIQNFIFNNFVATSGEIIQKYLQEFALHAAQLSVIGLLFLLITAILMLYNIEQAFNVIWRVKRTRHGVTALLSYWAILTLAPILIAIGFAFSSYFFSLPVISSIAGFLNQDKLFFVMMPFLLTITAFTLLYVVVPNCQVGFRYAFFGGLVAAILFELAKHGFAIYFRLFPTYELLYGTLAAVPIFFLWIYFSWLIVLFGAEISHSLMFGNHYSDGEPLDGFTRAFYWLGYLFQAQQKGEGLTLHEMSSLDKKTYQVSAHELLEQLIVSNLIQPTGEGKYFLSRDLNNFTLNDLYQVLPWKLPTAGYLSQDDDWSSALIEEVKEANTALDHTLQKSLASLFSSSFR
jgi:membrane protein